MQTDIAYKILTMTEFANLQNGTFAGAPVDVIDGYIHLSTGAQLDDTLNKHFAGQQDLIIAAIPLARLGSALRWEISRGDQLFPHYYGKLMISHVSTHMRLERDDDNRARLPDGL